ncbi:hypothetical protein MW7_013020 [Imbroritus primus]|uniref:Uncharacterized protein n=1 Tax=Imbroritus primus TaxID=3058603 RepID=A0ACD3SMD4_9BURK|nr:hypothetical protein MW7_013020 [Burkholderiaceae bacterium PBA]
MMLASLRGLAVLGVLSATPPLQGAHALIRACRYAGGSKTIRIPHSALARTASLHFANVSNTRRVTSA